MAYATVQDVEDSLGRPISSGAETIQVETWLERVEARIRNRITNLSELVEDPDTGAAFETLVIGVEVDTVIRRINNPTGKKSERIDDYSYDLTTTSASSDLWPTADEWDELTPTSSGEAFTITPYGDPDYCAPDLWVSTTEHL